MAGNVASDFTCLVTVRGGGIINGNSANTIALTDLLKLIQQPLPVRLRNHGKLIFAWQPTLVEGLCRHRIHAGLNQWHQLKTAIENKPGFGMALGNSVYQRGQPFLLTFTGGVVFRDQLIAIQGIKEKTAIALLP